MTLNSGHHHSTPLYDTDPLTDSGIQRAVGTVVRLHMTEKRYLDVGLTDIRGVVSWRDVVGMVARHAPIEILAPVRYIIASGMVVYAEAVSDWPPDA